MERFEKNEQEVNPEAGVTRNRPNSGLFVRNSKILSFWLPRIILNRLNQLLKPRKIDVSCGLCCKEDVENSSINAVDILRFECVS